MTNPQVGGEAVNIRTETLSHFSVIDFKYKVPVMELSPTYQREGNVWSSQQQSRLIDTIVNGLDMPKIYFEVLRDGRVHPETGRTLVYAVLDGRQRLEAISGFLNGQVALPDDFIYFEDPSVEGAGMTLPDLLENEATQILSEKFLEYKLPVVEVITDSGDLIEEMFQRLNSSTSLNAAEKRNAISCGVRDASNELAKHQFFVDKVAIKNARYKYRELSSKFLLIEHQIEESGRIRDTKAASLMDFFLRSKNGVIGRDDVLRLEERVFSILERMNKVFENNDSLLKSVGTIVVYYLAFRDETFLHHVSREGLLGFEAARRESQANDDEISDVDEVLRRYNAFVQSTNDGTPLSFRADVLKSFIYDFEQEYLPESITDLLARDIVDFEELS